MALGRPADLRRRPTRSDLRDVFEGVHPGHRTVDSVMRCVLCAAVFWAKMAKLQALDRGGARDSED